MPFKLSFDSVPITREVAVFLHLQSIQRGLPPFRTSIRSALGQLVALVTVLATAAAADAGIGSWGDAIAYVGDGGHAAWMIGQSQDVGYKYSHVAMLGLNFWAWDGTYCVYQKYEKKYVPISSAEAAHLLGRDEKDLRPPFEYRYPLGLLIFGPFLVLGLLFRMRYRDDKSTPAESGTEKNENSKGTDEQEKRHDADPF